MILLALQLGEMTGHQQWYPGGAYRLGMAEIYLSTLANSKASPRAAFLIGAYIFSSLGLY